MRSANMTETPQFGTPDPGKTYRDRPAAFGLAERDGLLALVRVTTTDRGAWFDLPGGALDPGETAETALIREFGEEAGLKVRAGRLVGRAAQYFLLGDGEPVNNRCSFFEAPVELADEGLKVEQDHTLVWLSPGDAVRALRHNAHAWGVAAWLRSRSG